MSEHEVPDDVLGDMEPAQMIADKFNRDRRFKPDAVMTASQYADMRRLHHQATERVRRFLQAWDTLGQHDDLIYGLGVHREDDTRDLLASDLKILTDYQKG